MLARDFQQAALIRQVNAPNWKPVRMLRLGRKKFDNEDTIQGIDHYQADFEHPNV